MDLDPSSFMNSEQRTSRGDHRYITKGLGHDKAYNCTFCKRGFSNAQALGGHMNVHRKDRARLKEFPCENSLSLEISRSTTTDRGDSSLPTELSSLTSQKPSSPSGTDAKENSCLPYEDGDPRVVDEDPIRDLPLFYEEPSVSEVGEKHETENIGKGRVEEELGSSRAVSRVEVDLELRLGPEPA